MKKEATSPFPQWWSSEQGDLRFTIDQWGDRITLQGFSFEDLRFQLWRRIAFGAPNRRAVDRGGLSRLRLECYTTEGFGKGREAESMATKTRLTAQDLWRLGEGDVRRELVNGEVIEMAPVGGTHGQVTIRVSRRLAEHVERHGGGEVVGGDVGFILQLPNDPERVRAPDVAFVSRQRLPEGGLPEGFLVGPPDLAVEVLSPTDNPMDVQQKIRDYLEAGTRLVWFFAPRPKTVTVYRADGSARLLREHEVLTGEDVLPGLTIPLAEIFP